MSQGFEQIKPSIENADRRIDASQTNVNLAKVEAEFRKVEAALKAKDPRIREQYEKILAEQRAKFDGLKEGNDKQHLDQLRAAVKDTLVALDDFAYENHMDVTNGFPQQYAEITGVATIYAAWRKDRPVKFSTIAHIIQAYLPGMGSYGSENYRRAVFLFLNQRPSGAQGKTESYDASKVQDATQWARAEGELRKIRVNEQFDFWQVRVALGQPTSRPPATPAEVATGAAVPEPELVPLVPPQRSRAAVRPQAAPIGAAARGAPDHAALDVNMREPAGSEAPALTPLDQMALATFAKGIEAAFGRLQKADDQGSIEKALGAIKAEADGIALYEKKNPQSAALAQLRPMRMQCELFLTNATLATRTAQAQDTAHKAQEDTRGFWAGLRVLNAVPNAYRFYTGDNNTMTYDEARAAVMKGRAQELDQAGRGGLIAYEAMSQQPPISLRVLQNMGPKKLLEAGLAKAGKEREAYGALNDFLASPEGQRLLAIEKGTLTAQLDQALAQRSLRIEEGSFLGVSDAAWEKAGNVSSSLASLDQVALTLATGGGALVGKLAAQSAWAVRGAAAVARGVEAAKAIRGVGLAVRVAEKAITWSPAELKALRAAESAGRTVNIAKALARGTLSLGTSLVKFTGASIAAESVVPGAGHLVLAACFVVPGGMKGFSEAIGKNVSEAFAVAGGNMAAGQMPEMTRAYLLYLRSTQTQAALAKNLQASLQGGGMVVADAEKAANAFARDLFEGKTGQELQALAAQKKPGLIASVREYLGARRTAKAAQERVGGMPRYPERYRAGAQREAQEAGARVREALGPVGKIDKLPGIVREKLAADLRQTADDFVNAYNRVVDALANKKKLAASAISVFSAGVGAMVRNLNELARKGGAGVREVWEKAAAQYRVVVDAVKNDRAAQRLLDEAAEREGGVLKFGEIGLRRAEAGAGEARSALVENLGLKRIVELPGKVRGKLALDARQTADDFVSAYNRVADLLAKGRDFAGEKGAQALEGFRSMVQTLNRLASRGGAGAKEAWNAAMARYRAVVDAVGNDRAAQRLLSEAERREGGVLKFGQIGLKKAEVGAAEARVALHEVFGTGRIASLPGVAREALAKDLKQTVDDFVGGYNRVIEVLQKGGSLVGDSAVRVREGFASMIGNLNRLARSTGAGAKAAWEAAAGRYRALVDAVGNDRAAQRLLSEAERREGGVLKFGEIGLRRAEAGAAQAREGLYQAAGLKRIAELPGNLATAVREGASKLRGEFEGIRARLENGFSGSKEKVGEWVTARREELGRLWSTASGLSGEGKAWALAQWRMLSNGLERLASNAKTRGIQIVDATGEYVAARKAVRAAGKMEGGVLPGGTVRLEAEKRAFARARIEFADAIGLTQLKSLADSALVGLKEGTQKAARAFMADANAFVEKYAGLAKAARAQSGAFLAEARALKDRVTALIGELPVDSPLRPLLASTGQRLEEVLK